MINLMKRVSISCANKSFRKYELKMMKLRIIYEIRFYLKVLNINSRYF